jgi:hypothetical protein
MILMISFCCEEDNRRRISNDMYLHSLSLSLLLLD